MNKTYVTSFVLKVSFSPSEEKIISLKYVASTIFVRESFKLPIIDKKNYSPFLCRDTIFLITIRYDDVSLLKN